jgi:hypothetical protein
MTRGARIKACAAALVAMLAAVPAYAGPWEDRERYKLKGIDAVKFDATYEHINFDPSCNLGEVAHDKIVREIEYFSAQQLRLHFVTQQDHWNRLEELYADPSINVGTDASGHLVIPPDRDKKLEAANHYGAMPRMHVHVTTFSASPRMCAAILRIEIEAPTTENWQAKIAYNGAETSPPWVSLWGPGEMVARAGEPELWGVITECLTKQLKNLVVDWTAAQ